MGTVSSSSRRRAAGSQPSSSSWVKALDVENDEEAAARADADADAHALEAKGDKLMSQARRELHGVWSYVSRPFIVAARARFYFHKAAETFVLANSCESLSLSLSLSLRTPPYVRQPIASSVFCTFRSGCFYLFQPCFSKISFQKN